MKSLFSNPSDIEKSVKEKYSFPPFIMMENAATALADEITKIFDEGDYDDILIVCGKGNNGADGLAVARKLYWKLPVQVCCLWEVVSHTGDSNGKVISPQTGNSSGERNSSQTGSLGESEAATQFQMATKIGVPFISINKLKSLLKNKAQNYIIIDCIYGTGFHGELSAPDAEIITLMNNAKGFKIACDIPSGLRFKADLTVTMGTLKTVLYSDEAKDFCGEIKLAELGISENVFEKGTKPDAYLIEENDIKLPIRTEKKTHKGKFGHALIIAGEKSGAGIMASESALSFGTGLVSILKTPSSNLSQFKISPELMITENYPKKTTAVLIGSGLGMLAYQNAESLGTVSRKPTSEKLVDSMTNEVGGADIVNDFIGWFKASQNPACVIDADFFALDFENINHSTLAEVFSELNSVPNARIVLTPHAKELCDIYEKCLATTENYTPNEILNHRIEIGKAFTKKYPKITLVMKGANTFIASDGEIYIFDGGVQSLAKGGSGDILAGMITALLAQGYSAKDAAITAVFRHGMSAKEFGAESYNLTPRKLLKSI